MSVSEAYDVEISDIAAMKQALETLKNNCDEMLSVALGATGAVSAQWSGIANMEFQSNVQRWQVGAAMLAEHARFLTTWAGQAAESYDEGKSAAGRMWGAGGGTGGGGPMMAV